MHTEHVVPLNEGLTYRHTRTYRKGAARRGHSFELTQSECRVLFLQDCHYCGSPPLGRVSTGSYSTTALVNGIDRLDNERGYTVDNVVTCCKFCNRAKFTYPIAEFLAWIERVRAG